MAKEVIDTLRPDDSLEVGDKIIRKVSNGTVIYGKVGGQTELLTVDNVLDMISYPILNARTVTVEEGIDTDDLVRIVKEMPVGFSVSVDRKFEIKKTGDDERVSFPLHAVIQAMKV